MYMTLLHDCVCSQINLVGVPSVNITTAQYEGVLPSRLRVCWIFIVLIPSQVTVHYSSSNTAECIVYIITVRLTRAVCWEAMLLHILHTPTFTNMLSNQRANAKRMRERNWPSPGMIRSVTVFPASLIRLTISEWDLLVMEQPFTARIRSPTFSFPQRSAGLPSMMRPILWGIATHAFPAFGQQWLSMYEF